MNSSRIILILDDVRTTKFVREIMMEISINAVYEDLE